MSEYRRKPKTYRPHQLYYPSIRLPEALIFGGPIRHAIFATLFDAYHQSMYRRKWWWVIRIAISWTQDKWSTRRWLMSATFAERMSFRLQPLSPPRQFSPEFDHLLQQHN
jgi:hypothetical protein